MAYSTIETVKSIIAQTLTTATSPTSDTPGDLINIGNEFDKNLITDDIVYQYINWGDTQINAVLEGMYKVPFCPKADMDTTLIANIDDYNSYVIVESDCSLNVGDSVVLSDPYVEEEYTISDIIDVGIYSVDGDIFPFEADVTRVLRIKYPDPIPLISARIAAANIYDKYFSAQSSPAQSEYGAFIRKMALSDLNNILHGRIVLYGVERYGYRFANSQLIDRYNLRPGNADNNTDLSEI